MAKRQGLGRGLGALLGEKPEDVMLSDGKPALRDVDIAQVKPNPDQPRKDFSQLPRTKAVNGFRLRYLCYLWVTKQENES